MFTGIVEATAKITALQSEQGSKLITIARPAHFEDIKLGSSIACNGICLTVLEYDSQSFTVQVMHETLSKSSAAFWKIGSYLNLERALKLGERLDGHWVMGHIDRSVKFLRKALRGNTAYYHFELPAADRKYLIPQGSIAIDGTSLTIAELNLRDFAIALISHTIEHSIMPTLSPGALVNLEYDALGKYILQRDI